MQLEEIVRTYGWYDYYEQMTGRIFHFSDVRQKDEKTLLVPVSEYGSDEIIGYAEMQNIK